MNADGTYSCARCGANVGSGGVSTCVVVNDLDPDQPGAIRVLRFCRDRENEDGEDVRGCHHRLLGPAMIGHYTDSQETTT